MNNYETLNDIIFLLNKKSLVNWNIFYTKDLINLFKTKKRYDYWVKILQKNLFLWKFEKSFFIFQINKDMKEAIIEYFNFRNLPFYFSWMELFNSAWYTTQIPNTLEIFNTKYSWLKKINWMYYSFNKIKNCYFWKWIDSNWFISRERFILDFIMFWDWYINENRKRLKYLQELKLEIDNMDISSYIINYPNIIKQKVLWFIETIDWINLKRELNNSKVKITKQYINITQQKWLPKNVIKNINTKTLFYY